MIKVAGCFQRGLHFAVSEHRKGVWIKELLEILILVPVGIGIAEQAVVQANLGIEGMRCRYPVKGAFYLALSLGRSAMTGWIVSDMNFSDQSIRIFYNGFTFNDIG